MRKILVFVTASLMATPMSWAGGPTNYLTKTPGATYTGGPAALGDWKQYTGGGQPAGAQLSPPAPGTASGPTAENLGSPADIAASAKARGESLGSGPYPLKSASKIIYDCANSFNGVANAELAEQRAVALVNGQLEKANAEMNGDREAKNGKGAIGKFTSSFAVTEKAEPVIAGARAVLKDQVDGPQGCSSLCKPPDNVKATDGTAYNSMDTWRESDTNLVLAQHKEAKTVEEQNEIRREVLSRYQREFQPALINMYKSCTANRKVIAGALDEGFKAAQDLASNSRSALLKWGAGIGIAGAVVGGVVMYKDHQDDKKAEQKVTDLKTAYDNGVINSGTPDELNCLTDLTYQRPECRQVMFDYCAKPANGSKSGCTSFSTYYCSAADANQGYCVASATKTYCKSVGTLTAQSPGCQWLSTQPLTCGSKPEDIACLTSLTPADLTTKCVNFPNDPLCLANKAGKVVTQPGAATFTNNGTGGTTTTTTTTTTGTTNTGTTTTVVPISSYNICRYTSTTNISCTVGNTPPPATCARYNNEANKYICNTPSNLTGSAATPAMRFTISGTGANKVCWWVDSGSAINCRQQAAVGIHCVTGGGIDVCDMPSDVTTVATYNTSTGSTGGSTTTTISTVGATNTGSTTSSSTTTASNNNSAATNTAYQHMCLIGALVNCN